MEYIGPTAGFNILAIPTTGIFVIKGDITMGNFNIDNSNMHHVNGITTQKDHEREVDLTHECSNPYFIRIDTQNSILTPSISISQ